jgi:hypothetical protein
MAKKLSTATDQGARPASGTEQAAHAPAVREYDLVDDIVFDPPLSPEELRRRYGIGISWEERLELARRRLAESKDAS